ncbi:unnamed protein product [Protopolystoma xenopodis]|uniref:Uncharacterized protein n=1 Tax=Protopolystoma xenopodis TaxID=117903 RepID=A0A448WNC0_9PLAT|nr:unnamed protein product [Protopolystoma xenopodis]
MLTCSHSSTQEVCPSYGGTEASLHLLFPLAPTISNCCSDSVPAQVHFYSMSYFSSLQKHLHCRLTEQSD